MDIKKLLRKALFEGKHKNHKNEFGCVMVNLELDTTKWKNLLGLIDDKDLYIPENDKSFGKEKSPHITILFGLHADVSDEEIEKEVDKIKAPEFKLNKISIFKNDLFEVIKFDVESEDLVKLNKRFSKFPHTKTFDYHPHCTIAYLKPDKASKYLEKLNTYLDESNNLNAKSSEFLYSKVDGSEKKYSFS